MTPRSWLYLPCLLLTLLFYSHPAQAYSCSATSPGTQTLANVSPISGSSYGVSGTIAVTCTVGLLEGLLNGTSLIACLNISGASGSTPRSLTGGSGNLQYNLYTDPAHTQVWGSSTSAPPGPVAVVFNLGLLGILLGGTASQNIPIYSYIPANQTTVPAGAYTQLLSGGSTSVNFTAYTGTQPTCSSAWTNGGGFAFTVSAGVINDCNIGATNIGFPTSGVLGSALAATGTITAQCTAGDSYSIALNGGSTPGATVTTRQMLLLGGGAAVGYQLYTSGGYGTIWGDGSGGSGTQGATASGGNQAYTVYGQVPAQATPNPGSYSDTVTATITY